jgi:hypothetical protein
LIPFKRFVLPTFIPLFNSGKGWAYNFCPEPQKLQFKEKQKFALRSLMPDFFIGA